MNNEYNDVKKFQKTFGHPSSDTPVTLSFDRAKTRSKWMLEEINEFLDASKNQDLVEQADAMMDIIYFALGTLVEMGVEPDELFSIIHNANMNKLWSDGTPHYNETGKVIIPDSWENPHEKLDLAIQKMKRK